MIININWKRINFDNVVVYLLRKKIESKCIKITFTPGIDIFYSVSDTEWWFTYEVIKCQSEEEAINLIDIIDTKLGTTIINYPN